MEQQKQYSFWHFVAAFMVIVTVQNYFFQSHIENLPYSEFKTLLKNGKVKDIG